jgi:hypothetical protein
MLLALVVAAPVSAGGGCPRGGGWNLVSIEFTLPNGIDVGNFHDQNGDGLVCYRVNKGQSQKNGFESWTVKDNTNPS